MSTLSGEELCGDFEVLIEKKIGKWSERSDFVIPSFKDSSKIFVVMTLLIILADFLATRVGLFTKQLHHIQIVNCKKLMQFMLRFPIR